MPPNDSPPGQTPPPNRIVFNVGGTRFEILRTTIMQFPQTLLAEIISRPQNADADGSFYIDRDSEFFSHVLNYYRWGGGA